VNVLVVKLGKSMNINGVSVHPDREFKVSAEEIIAADSVVWEKIKDSSSL